MDIIGPLIKFYRLTITCLLYFPLLFKEECKFVVEFAYTLKSSTPIKLGLFLQYEKNIARIKSKIKRGKNSVFVDIFSDMLKRFHLHFVNEVLYII